jgi:hypothetical protein
VTLEFQQLLRNSKQEAMEAWAKESFIGSSLEEGAVQNATAIGGIRVLDDTIGQIDEFKMLVAEPNVELVK